MSLATVVLAIVILMRLGELILSRRRLQADMARGAAVAIPEATYPWMVAVHVAWIAGCALEPLLWPSNPPTWLVTAALVGWLAALALRFWLMAVLGRLWNVRLVERQQQPIVTAGPYRFIRHPNYLAVIIELAAVPLALGAYGTFAVASIANAIVLYRRILREEAYLLTIPEYTAAFAARKRLIPGVF